MAALHGRCSSGYCRIVHRRRCRTDRLSLALLGYSIRISGTGAKMHSVSQRITVLLIDLIEVSTECLFSTVLALFRASRI